MPAEIFEQSGKLICVKITGKLAKPELDRVQKAAVGMIEREGKINVLVVIDEFQGWEKEGDWEDMSFISEHDTDIEKMAMVGDPEWKEMALAFAGVPYTSKTVEFFEASRLDEARAWLS